MSGDEHKADLERASNQNSFADVARVVENTGGGGLFTRLVTDPLRAVVGATGQGKAVFGSTDFDAKNLDLNQMVDLVEQTNPEDLESSGKALWDARDAIKAAAEELDGRITKLSWKGTAGNDFRTYGAQLVTSTRELSDFAGSAGDQITAAAMGLASVRSSMPPRDPQNRKRPESFTAVEKTADDKEYTAALKVEKDRQEAINQMNRLASYYAVSSQQLEVLQAKPPTFPNVPNVGVPEPKKWSTVSEESDPTVRTEQYQPPQQGREQTGTTDPTPPRQTDIDGAVTRPGDPIRRDPAVPDVNTDLNTVGTLPPNTTMPTTGPTSPVTGNPPITGQTGGPFPTPVAPLPNGFNKNTGGANGQRTPISAQGRARSGMVDPVTGRTNGPGATNQAGRPSATGATNPMGRSNPTASGSASGRPTGTGPGGRPYPMGGQGVTGGTPRAGGTQGPRNSGTPATGAGRANGVVGGRPATQGATPQRSGGAKPPRGTVIGASTPPGSRPPTGQTSQRGVFGASQPGSRPRTGTGRPGGRPNQTVTGNPTGRNSPTGAERNGMTRGGAGLVRGPGRNRRDDDRDRDDDRNGEETRRPDASSDCDETQLPNGPRRDVPPAVN
ncbi:hypothetical protein ACIQAC_29725 [Streptomyces sp. NPDC088387]|uniref:hypothetical protein n=1 Tax=Streptomyces sp. NPDC088387 TaxID=3365859 RepID=UPI0038162CE0